MSAVSGASEQITIVIPVWGVYVQRYLDDALESIRAQNVAVPIVLVDNADEPPIERPGVQIVRSEVRLALGAARNLGLRAVKTPMVMFWDADDLMLEGTLERLVTRLCQASEVVACAPSIIESPAGGRHHWPRRPLLALSRFKLLFATVNTVSSLYPVIGAALRTEAAQAALFPSVDVGDDRAMGVSLAFRGRILVDAWPGRAYRLHPDSLSAGWGRGHAVARARLVRARLRTDPAVPSLLRRFAPAISMSQHLVIWVISPLARRLRARAGSDAGRG